MSEPPICGRIVCGPSCRKREEGLGRCGGHDTVEGDLADRAAIYRGDHAKTEVVIQEQLVHGLEVFTGSR